MKKLIILSSFVVLAAWVTSCRKETVTRRGNSVTTVEPPTPVESVKIISDWFDLPLVLTVDRGVSYLQGRQEFNSTVIYDKNNHVELAYVAMPGQRIPVTSRLPMKLTVAQDIFDFQFLIDNAGFLLTVKNADHLSRVPDASEFHDFRYRYIIIPKTTYESLNIDWDNYNQVAIALNIYPVF